MKIIEPCCIHKQLTYIIDNLTLKDNSCAHFFSFSDWDIKDLLSFLRNYVKGGDLYISLISLDVSVINVIRKLLYATYIDKTDNVIERPYISKMILLVQPMVKQVRDEVVAQLNQFIHNGRLVVCEDNIGFRCIALEGPDHSLVFQGSLNKECSSSMQMCTITSGSRVFEDVKEMFQMKEHTKRINV